MFLFPSGFFVLVELNTIALIKIELKYKVFLLWTSDKDPCFRVCAKGSEVRRRRVAAQGCRGHCSQALCACLRTEVSTRALQNPGSMKLSLSCLERKLVRVWALNICLQRVGFPTCAISKTKSSQKMFFLDILWPSADERRIH